MSDIIVLGAGPAGLAAALELAESGRPVTLIERETHVGGNATSFNLAGVWVDYGSHRLHPASDRQVLDRIRNLLGDDLLTRPRHGRIRLLGRWIHFPLRPVDLALRLHPRFAFGVGLDLLRKGLPGSADAQRETFATILQKGLGRTICEEFYFPYARKIWGVDPQTLSPIQARKRVSSGSIGKMIKRLLPGGSGSGGASTKGVFYYPKQGFGQICEALLAAARAAGVNVMLGSDIVKIKLGDDPEVVVTHDGVQKTLQGTQIYSTIPVTTLTRLLDPGPPEDVVEAARSLEFRAMVLAYLVLDQDQFTEYDAHYFPGSDIPFTRLSEPKNYSDSDTPRGKTVLCAEIPCFLNDETWNKTDSELGGFIRAALADAGLPITSEVLEVHSRRIPYAYPLYRVGYEKQFEKVDAWLDAVRGLLSFGRQGLYVHDNTHHAIYMAQAAVRCLNEDGTIDRNAWHREREIFATHVVED